MQKIDTPQLNFPEPSNLRILHSNGEALLRSRTCEGESYTERVNVDNTGKRIIYTLIDHPSFEGYISEQILRSDSISPAGCILSFTVDWKVRDDIKHQNVPDLLGKANDELFHVKDIVEAEEAAAAAKAASQPVDSEDPH